MINVLKTSSLQFGNRIAQELIQRGEEIVAIFAQISIQEESLTEDTVFTWLEHHPEVQNELRGTMTKLIEDVTVFLNAKAEETKQLEEEMNAAFPQYQEAKAELLDSAWGYQDEIDHIETLQEDVYGVRHMLLELRKLRVRALQIGSLGRYYTTPDSAMDAMLSTATVSPVSRLDAVAEILKEIGVSIGFDLLDYARNEK